MEIYEVVQSTLGYNSGVSLWKIRSEAENESKRLAYETASRSKTRVVEQDEFDSKRWNVLDRADFVNFHGKPDDPPVVITGYYVVEREVH